MIRVLILTEGQTEETFVRDVLCPHFSPFGIGLISTLLRTKRTKAGLTFKGGITDYQKVKNDITRLLQDSNAACVTTMLDFYGLPSNFPGKKTLPNSDCFTRVAHLEKAFADNIGHKKFKPYLQLHEFESLLFSSPASIQSAFPGPSKEKELSSIVSKFSSPEHINDTPHTVPSKRLAGLFTSYNKVYHGPIIARYAGLADIRAQCDHFNKWITDLERLAH